MSTIKSQLSLLILSLCLVGLTAGSAFAQQGTDGAKPSEPAHQFSSVTQTSGVMLDKRVSQDIGLMGAVATQGEKSGERSVAVQKFFGEAFGQQAFSGEASDEDIWALNAGLMVGMLPYAAKYQPQAYQASVSWLTQHTEFADKLDEKVASEFKALVAKLEKGEKVDFNEAQTIFNGAFTHLSANADSRIHGYLAGGIWAALAYIDRTENIGAVSLALNGDTLAYLFRQNAKEGSIDHKLADAIAKIADELEKGKQGDTASIIASIGTMREVK